MRLAALGLCLACTVCSADEIGGSVGVEGVNQADDVLTVQILLNQVPSELGGAEPLLVPDGIVGPATVSAIRAFQQRQFGDGGVDGRVDPGGPTLERIHTLVAGRPLSQRIVQVALGERLFWEDGERTERDPRVSSRLQGYWSSVGREFSAEQLQDADFQAGHPWSAAFVSWVMKRAGAGGDFGYSAAHWRYVAAAKLNRIEDNENPFKAYRVTEQAPLPGGVVVKRRSNSTATYDNIENGHPTHGDIVVAVSADEVVTIGGNVGNSVRTTTVALSEDGHVANDLYFAVITIDEDDD